MARILRFSISVLFIGLTVGPFGKATETDSAPITFEQVELKIGSAALHAEVAMTEQQRARGLMYREKLAKDAGMFFVFDAELVPTFWMKNTLVPLSIAFVGRNLKIVDIQDMNPPASLVDQNIERHTSRARAKYAIEVNKGWFASHKVKVGDSVRLLSPKASPQLLRIFKGSST